MFLRSGNEFFTDSLSNNVFQNEPFTFEKREKSFFVNCAQGAGGKFDFHELAEFGNIDPFGLKIGQLAPPDLVVRVRNMISGEVFFPRD